MNVAFVIGFVGILVFMAHLFAVFFNRTNVPDVLWLILIGLVLGPTLGIVTSTHFGAVGPVFTTLTLILILFQGGLSLRLHDLKEALGGTLSLATVNFILSTVLVGFLGVLLAGLEPLNAFMLGAILGGTSSVIVIPLVRQLKMEGESSTILFLESSISDVYCIVVAIAFLEAYKVGELRVGLMAGHIISSFLLAGIFGGAGAFAWSAFLKQIRTFENPIFTTPAFVFVIYGLVEFLGYSGAIAALVFGVTLGNIEQFKPSLLKPYLPAQPISLNETEKALFSEAVFLLKTFFFVYIGISVRLADTWSVSLGLLLTLALFLLRIVVVRLSVPRSTPRTDASLMAVMVPKGLAAAVLASIPLQEGIPGGEVIQNVTYAVVLFSIVLTSLLIFLLDKTRLARIYSRIFSDFAPPNKNAVPV